MIKLDLTESECPEKVEWFCRNESAIRMFVRKLKGNHLIAYLCSSCYNKIHPLDLVLSGIIIEEKYRKQRYIY